MVTTIEKFRFVGFLWWVQELYSTKFTFFFSGTENRNGIELYHLQNTGKFFAFFRQWSLALVIQTKGTENFARFGKNGKKVIPSKGITIFSRKRMNRSIWILPGISGFSIQMVSAH